MNEETTTRAAEEEIPMDYDFEETAGRRLSLTVMGKIMAVWMVIVAVTIAIGVSKAKASEAQPASAAFAAIDLSALTDEEIITLSNRVSKEIVDRKIQKTATVPAGTYIIGVDIPAGKYVYTCTAKDQFSKDITVKESAGDEDTILSTYVGGPDSWCDNQIALSLADGNEFYSEAPFTLTNNPVVLFE